MYWSSREAKELGSLVVQEEIAHRKNCRDCEPECQAQLSSWVPLDPIGEEMVVEAALVHLEWELHNVEQDMREQYASLLSIKQTVVSVVLGAMHYSLSVAWNGLRAMKFRQESCNLRTQQRELHRFRMKYYQAFADRCMAEGADPALRYDGVREEGRRWSEINADGKYGTMPGDFHEALSSCAGPTLNDVSDVVHTGTQESTRIDRQRREEHHEYRSTTRNDGEWDAHPRHTNQRLLDNELRDKSVPPSDIKLRELMRKSTWERPCGDHQ